MIVTTTQRLNPAQQWLLVALIYALLVMVFCYPVLQGQVITQTDFLHFISPWDAVKPDHLVAPGNPFLQDQSTEFWPFFMEAKRQLSEGQFPLWNPFIFAGNPLWANTQSALLYPLNLFHYLFEAPVGFTINSLLKLFMGCLFMHLFLRRLGLSHGASLFGGVAFGFCSFTVFWLNHPHTNVTPLIPLSFYAVERLLAKPDRRNQACYALLVALTLLAGHVEIAFLTALGCGLYYLLRLWQLRQVSVMALWRFLAVHLWALLLAAVLIVPFVEFLFHTAIWSERGDAVQFSIPTAGLVNLLQGDFFIGAGWDPNGIGFHAFNAYVGLVTWPLILFAVLHGFKTHWPWVLLALLSLAIAFTVQPFNALIKSLPLFNHLPLFYFNVLAVFAVCVLSAVGLQQLLHSQQAGRRRHLYGVLLVLWVGLISVYWFWSPGGLVQYTQAPAAMLDSVQQHVLWAALVVSLVWLLLWLAKRLPQWLVVGLLVSALYVDVWRLAVIGIQPLIRLWQCPTKCLDPWPFWPNNPAHFAPWATTSILQPSTNMLARQPDVRGYDVPVIDRFHHFFDRALQGKDAFWVYNLREFEVSTWPFLNIMNARYLLTKKPLDPLPVGMQVVYDDEILIYENPQAMGHAKLFHQAEFVDSATAALDRVIELGAGLQEVVVIEATGPATEQVVASAQPATASHIEYLTTATSDLELQVHTDQAGWLVLSQSHYPGWQATINGEETAIFAANSLLQAIKIPPGDHRVSVSYQPASFTFGWVVSLLSLPTALWIIRNKK